MSVLGIQETTQTPPKTRLCELPNSARSHHEVLGQSLVYRISVAAVEFHEKTKRLRERDILTISHHNFPVLQSYERKSLAEGLKSFSRTVQKCATVIPFNVLYQMEALVKNGFLLPWTVEVLLTRMARIPKEKQSSAAKGAPKVR
jgi:hypothetical protein